MQSHRLPINLCTDTHRFSADLILAYFIKPPFCLNGLFSLQGGYFLEDSKAIPPGTVLPVLLVPPGAVLPVILVSPGTVLPLLFVPLKKPSRAVQDGFLRFICGNLRKACYNATSAQVKAVRTRRTRAQMPSANQKTNTPANRLWQFP